MEQGSAVSQAKQARDAPSEKLIDFVLVIMTKNTERVTDVIR